MSSTLLPSKLFIKPKPRRDDRIFRPPSAAPLGHDRLGHDHPQLKLRAIFGRHFVALLTELWEIRRK